MPLVAAEDELDDDVDVVGAAGAVERAVVTLLVVPVAAAVPDAAPAVVDSAVAAADESAAADVAPVEDVSPEM